MNVTSQPDFLKFQTLVYQRTRFRRHRTLHKRHVVNSRDGSFPVARAPLLLLPWFFGPGSLVASAILENPRIIFAVFVHHLRWWGIFQRKDPWFLCLKYQGQDLCWVSAAWKRQHSINQACLWSFQSPPRANCKLFGTCPRGGRDIENVSHPMYNT